MILFEVHQVSTTVTTTRGATEQQMLSLCTGDSSEVTTVIEFQQINSVTRDSADITTAMGNSAEITDVTGDSAEYHCHDQLSRFQLSRATKLSSMY